MKKLLLFLFLYGNLIFAQAPEKPSNYVTDVSNTLSPEQQQVLNKKLKAFEDSTSNQIFVFIDYSLNGAVLENFTQDLFVKWKVGQAAKNNGVLITVFIEDRKFRIQTGYGLEGVLPDIFTKNVQDNIMKPEFKTGDYYTGIDKGIDRLIAKAKGEHVQSNATGTTEDGLFFLFILFIPNIILWALLFTKIFKTKTSKVGLSIFAGVLALLPCFGSLVLLIWLIVELIKKNIPTSTGDSWRTRFYNFMKTKVEHKRNYSNSYSSRDSDSSWSSSSSSVDSSSSSDSFDGGGGGDSGGGGSSSDW